MPVSAGGRTVRFTTPRHLPRAMRGGLARSAVAHRTPPPISYRKRAARERRRSNGPRTMAGTDFIPITRGIDPLQPLNERIHTPQLPGQPARRVRVVARVVERPPPAR